eukprot:TRINITY_DN14932_c0_g1_i1.p1 TRINITY_DN14932_c0_g1~~TRINITY_DN14932_c0_g1_i1.p1  ORF type:complete len:429 (-),score=89.87 TRINITY_DN14932_c0_g1_i1:107-1393(-)
MNSMSGSYTVNNGSVHGDVRVWKLVLTGGPCGGKTTAQNRLATFFESLGWVVFRVPETATVLLGGGIDFTKLSSQQVAIFQENLLKTMFQIEDTFFELAETCSRNCLVICDRGAMDCSAYLPRSEWEKILEKHQMNEVDIRDNRYDQVIHLVTAARGAEEHYTRSNNKTRSESIEQAATMDRKVGEAWVGHPYYDVIDNTTEFETKMRKLTTAVTTKLSIPGAEDWLKQDSRKLKFLVIGIIQQDEFPSHRDFKVHHDYLPCITLGTQARIRRRGRGEKWMYTHTVRRHKQGEIVETRTSITRQIYDQLLAQADRNSNVTIVKTRKCFVFNNHYFHLDIYESPHTGLMLLETYSAMSPEEISLPPFLEIKKNVTGDPRYSMFNLSRTDNNDTLEDLNSDENGVLKEEAADPAVKDTPEGCSEQDSNNA